MQTAREHAECAPGLFLLLRNSAADLCISWNVLQSDGFMPRYSLLMESRREAARA